MTELHQPDGDWRDDLQRLATRFARERLAPAYQAREAQGAIDRGLLREMGELGLIGPELPEAFGGAGLPSVAAGLVMEAIAYGDFNIAYVQLLGSLIGQLLARNAAAPLAGTWVPRLIRGEALIGLGLTEPGHGSDAAALMLRARRDGDVYRLSGEKTSISLADQADAFIVFARTGQVEDRARGISAFLVTADSAGLSRTRMNDLGSKVIGRGSLFFDDVAVPAAHLIGAEGKGFVQVMQGFDYSRALIGLQCCGAAQASLDESWAYAKTRQTFGQPLAAYQGVTFPLAEGEARVAAARQLCYHTLALRDDGRPHTAEAAMSKYLAPKTAVEVIHQCLLTHGHYGWSLDLPHQQRLRDVMGLEIGDGTAQVMHLIVSRDRLSRT